MGNKAELMKLNAFNIDSKLVVELYNKIKNFRKTADQLNLTRTSTLKLLRELNIIVYKKMNYKMSEKRKEELRKIASNRTGNKNPFYGRTHTKKTKEKLSKWTTDRNNKRNPNYKHGKYKRRPRDFKISEFQIIRKQVFQRDCYTCIYCLIKGGELHAHHKIPYWVEKRAYFDLDNLVTVCTKCHFKKAHLGSWFKFDTSIISNDLLNKYSLNGERLNDLAVHNNIVTDAIVRTSDINKTEEIDSNDLSKIEIS